MTRVVALVLALSSLGCGDYRGPRAAMDRSGPPSPLGPYSVRYAQTITPARRLLVEQALWAHHNALDVALTTPAWQIALGNPTPINTAWPQRDVYVYDLAWLRAPHALAVQGWVDLDDHNALHLAAGEGDVLPAASSTLVQSVYLPYDPYHQAPVWPYVLDLEARTVATLRHARGLP